MQTQLNKEKNSFLTDYIEEHKLQRHVELSTDHDYLIIHQSTMLEHKLKEWTKNGEVIALNPAQISISTIFLWIALFASKREYSVVVETSLSPALQETFSYVFSSMLNKCSLLSNGQAFQIQSFFEVFLLSIELKRSYVETGEFGYMLSDKDKRRLRKIMAEEDEGRMTNA